MKTLAVIGHGRSPEGRGWGEAIDACETVRMWDHLWQDPADYGRRYDYGMYELLPSITEVFIERNERTPAKGWLAYKRAEVKCPIPRNTIMITQVYRDIAWAMGGRGASSSPATRSFTPQGDGPLYGEALRRALIGARPPSEAPARPSFAGMPNASLNLTRGCAAACWAVAEGKAERVILVGFDNLEKGQCLPTDEAFAQSYQEHYDSLYPRWRNGGWYTPGLTTCGTHDIAMELPLLRHLAQLHNVDLRFAHEVWQ